jgi:outer membrane protein OmpA-like peptidoglycan-associated protein
MDGRGYGRLATAGVTFGLIFLSVGCATKNFVRNDVQSNIQPLEAKLDTTNKKVNENGERITDLDRKTETGIAQAQSSADAAKLQAATAQQSAEDARGLAQKGISEADSVKQEVENADNFQSVKKATILFGFGKSKLTSEDTQALDDVVQAVDGMKHYVIEVRGFTDNVGGKQYNLQLSRRRADAVVRYLTLEKQIPLVRVYMAGYGDAGAAAPNKTRHGREQNRRVDVNILAPQAMASAQAQSFNSTSAQANNQK